MNTKNYIIDRDQHKNIIIENSGIYKISLEGPGASANISGSFTLKNDEKLNLVVLIHHKAPNTYAQTKLHGVARDESFISFSGKIIIDKNCGNTNSFLTERVLLLSDDAKAECIPDLEIESDDVKCSHAASITKINNEQLFYLMSRGIKKKNAEDLIIDGFLNL